MTIAALISPHASLVVGLLIFGGCLFTAGWVLRGERDLQRRIHGRPRRWRDTRPSARGRIYW